MTVQDFPQSNGLVGVGQKQYIPLPIYHEAGLEGCVTTLWRATWRERIKFLFTGELWLQQLTFNKDIQPQKPLLDSPFPAVELEHATIGSDETSADCTLDSPGA